MEMESVKDKILKCLLTPLSWLYGAGVEVRNKFFDWKILPSENFDVPVICVGNIAVGGTGKTPHVEYLISHLYRDYNIGVVSRGYKRSTRGFVLANPYSTPDTIGDEPYQIYSKYGRKIRLAVCENRRKGIKTLLDIDRNINLLILDDGFQHRYVNPSISIVLMDYKHPVYEDSLLPLGRLREQKYSLNRADYVLVTKCPELTPLAYSLITGELDLMSYQNLFFSGVEYQEVAPVFEDESRYSVSLTGLTSRDSVLLVTGIAWPRGLVKYLAKFPFRLKICHFPDHHSFTRKDLERMENMYREMKGARKIILTTEKDAVRMIHNPYFPVKLKPFCFYLPIKVSINGPDSEEKFFDTLKESIRQYRKKVDEK